MVETICLFSVSVDSTLQSVRGAQFSHIHSLSINQTAIGAGMNGKASSGQWAEQQLAAPLSSWVAGLSSPTTGRLGPNEYIRNLLDQLTESQDASAVLHLCASTDCTALLLSAES